MNIGIIGLGRMGKNHLKILCGIKEAANTSLKEVYIYDTNTKEAEALSRVYKVKSCASKEELKEHVDAVIICTPTCTHFDIAEYYIENGKDIFIEKPVTSTVETAELLKKRIEDKKAVCMVGHIERFNPAVLYLKKYLEDKRILSLSADRISKVEPGRVFDVDAVRDLMIHDIDIVLSIVNCKVEKIAAVSNSPDLNDVFAIIQFQNDITANLNVNRFAFERDRKLYVNTDEEAIHLDFIKRKIEFHRPPNALNLAESDRDNKHIIGIKKTIYFESDSLKNEQLHFIDCIESRAMPVSNCETGALALNIANQIVKHTAKKG